MRLPPSDDSAARPLAAATNASFGTGADAYDEIASGGRGPQCGAAKTLPNQAAVALTGLVTRPNDARAAVGQARRALREGVEGLC